MAAPLFALARWSRSLHRWIAYGLGAVVALWVITGIVMVLPARPTTHSLPAATIDPRAAVHSPAEAAKALPDNHGPVRSVTLRDLGGRLVYHIALLNAAHVFVDATTVQRIEFSDSLATAVARRVMRDSTAALNRTRLTAHDAEYTFGALPAYRVELRDGAGTVIFVAADGSINATSGRSRFRAIMGHLHRFDLPWRPIADRPRRLALLGTSVLSIVLILTGYVLVLPRRWRS